MFKFICIMNKKKENIKEKIIHSWIKNHIYNTIFCFLEQYPDINGVKLLSFPASWDHHSCVVSKWDLIFLLSRHIFIVINPNFVAFWVWLFRVSQNRLKKYVLRLTRLMTSKYTHETFYPFCSISAYHHNRVILI